MSNSFQFSISDCVFKGVDMYRIDINNKIFLNVGDSYQLDLDGSLLVGGIGTVIDNAAIPPSLWSATLRHGYVGCMRDFVINGNAVDLAAFARQQDSGKKS